MSSLLPALNFDPNSGIFIADIFGCIVALPFALFLAFWLSSVKNWRAVVIGALIGAVLGFLIIQAWVGTLIFDTPLPNVNTSALFFSSIFICFTLAISLGILTDLLIARRNARDYRRPNAVEE
jgi:hypothetical protein